ncbi:hypothetical protein DL770_000353 [Monosporascus sp. CRB-9-2]|nr:hypothetical protein DL770_000353 [Monosporascus sp. CRB-9-2]
MGSKYTFLKWAAFNVSMGRDSNNPVDPGELRSDIELVTSADKAFFFAGKYDWRGQGGDPLEAFYRVIEESPAAAGGAFWSLFGRNIPDYNPIH